MCVVGNNAQKKTPNFNCSRVSIKNFWKTYDAALKVWENSINFVNCVQNAFALQAHTSLWGKVLKEHNFSLSQIKLNSRFILQW